MLADVVTGRDAFDVAGMAEAMARQVRNIGRPGVAATAISAVDIALWDLKARLLGQPLAGLLGLARQDVPIYGSGGFTSYDDTRTRQQLSEWVDKESIPRVKIKIGESWGGNERRDLARAELAREVIGPDAELYVDANGGYWPGHGPAAGAARRGGRRVQLVASRLRAAAGGRRGRLPAARRDPVRRCHRVHPRAALAAAHNLQVSGHWRPASRPGPPGSRPDAAGCRYGALQARLT